MSADSSPRLSSIPELASSATQITGEDNCEPREDVPDIDLDQFEAGNEALFYDVCQAYEQGAQYAPGTDDVDTNALPGSAIPYDGFETTSAVCVWPPSQSCYHPLGPAQGLPTILMDVDIPSGIPAVVRPFSDEPVPERFVSLPAISSTSPLPPPLEPGPTPTITCCNCGADPVNMRPKLPITRQVSFLTAQAPTIVYSCDSCSKTFTREDSLKRHKQKSCMNKLPGDNAERFRCDVCGIFKDRKDKMQLHCQIVHQQKKKHEEFKIVAVSMG